MCSSAISPTFQVALYKSLDFGEVMSVLTVAGLGLGLGIGIGMGIGIA